ncbi:MAG TPA: DUF3991 and toprim domain-containing protein [Clostridia bacterium]|nr:DUF3991 and toprim domain-containing protein [Clostridia bacterium]
METNRYPVSEEQITEAKKHDLLTYLQLYEPDELVHVSGDAYCTRSHDSMVINNGMWYWRSRGIGGKTALDYLIKVQGYSFVDAVEKLCGISLSYSDTAHQIAPAINVNQEKRPFSLPAANFTSNVVIDYLCNKRGLPKEVVLSLISKKLIYESREHHNAVFVGHDKTGIPRFATIRGCYDKPFKKDVEGSNKAIGFSIPARDPAADMICVFESAIDAISFGVLNRSTSGCAHFLSLGGVSPLALDHYLSEHPHIKRVVMCLDNDKGGRKATEKIKVSLEARDYEVDDMPPRNGKDYNEELKAHNALKCERGKCR